MLKGKIRLSVLSLTLATSLFASANVQATTTTTSLFDAVAQSSQGETPSLAPMLKNVIPCVVNISVKGKKEVAPMLDIPEEFKFMFPGIGAAPQQREFRALGSGVIIDAQNGLVVTNHHVIDDADEIRIALSDGREFNAKKIGSDPHTDLALVKLEDFSDLKELPFADSDSLEVGDFAVAIGNPFGLGQTVTSGIISALGRTGLNIENIENFIQTDAAINSGNSGGALVNLKGELIGINTAILGPNGGNIGIGFAIPSNMVKTVVAQLEEFGEVHRGQLGLLGTELTADLAESFGYKGNNGAFINEVIKDGAADKAGIKSGDIITSIDGKKISSFGELRAKVATLAAGSKVKLGIFRDGKNIEITVTLQETKEAEFLDTEGIAKLFSGAKLENHEKGGVIVSDIKPRSNAQYIGLKNGDIIIGVNREEIKDLASLKKELKKTKGKVSALKIKRGSSTVFITIR